jgi:subtilisin family serine protease
MIRNTKKSTVKKSMGLALALAFITLLLLPSNSFGNTSYRAYGQGPAAPTGNATSVNATEPIVPTKGNIIADEYIVVLRENATFEPQATNGTISALSNGLTELGANVTAYPNVGAFSINLSQPQGISNQTGVAAAEARNTVEELQGHPDVAYIEPNQVFTIESQKTPSGIDRAGADNSLTMAGDGEGNVSDATIAIIDTGIDLTHPDLNVYKNLSFVDGTSSGNDDNGHGTHVAGIAAAKDDSQGVVGVAPGARLIALKVLNEAGSGTTADIIAAIDWVTAHADETDVVNMSLGGGTSQAMNDAIERSVDKGTTYVVAAGNEHRNAFRTSPANSPDAITVSAIADSDGECGAKGPATSRGTDDSFASYSNWGQVVDIAAPGTNINSTSMNGQYEVLTGTSMASPHVAGAAALWLSQAHKTGNADVEPREVRDALVGSAIRDAPAEQCNESRGYYNTIDDLDTIREPLLFVTDLVPPQGPPVEPEPPVQRYVLEATDTRSAGSVYTVEVSSLGELQEQINRLVQGTDQQATAGIAASTSSNDTVLANNVDQIVDSIASLQQRAPGALGTEVAGATDIVDAKVCFNIGWFRICVTASG